jgi:glucose-6-phosphate isomerase
VNVVDAATIGTLIALFERTVGLYASLVNINAYHQPGVEAGKKAAVTVIALQLAVVELLKKQKTGMTALEIATKLGTPDQAESVFAILRHLAANPDRGITSSGLGNVEDIKFSLK